MTGPVRILNSILKRFQLYLILRLNSQRGSIVKPARFAKGLVRWLIFILNAKSLI